RRHFGHLHLWKSVDDCPGLNALGIDALSRDFTPHCFAALLSASKRPLKDFLLDQSRVAGIGNIYSCESLWQARLDPRRRANTLKPREVRRLHKAIVSVLARALECCLHPAPNFRDPDWRSEEHTSELQSRRDLVCRLLLEKKKRQSKVEPKQ